MTADPRAALDRLIAALEAHFDAIVSRRSDDDPRVDDAYDVVADAFDVYEDALAQVHGEVLPFVLEEDDDDEDDEDDDESDDEPDDEDEDDEELDDDELDSELEDSRS
ncbi:primosomal protein [Xylanimonas protaetiae]|uniref:Primosomal protein n=1 Tax=Xylanimonas protaetiae TaxID=2509457 RepID=A0A4P6F7L5_9MICO|nr:primosomal protein [Xylanimonas protaetiae]QAY70853.1 primosomal protein [Xylanimonas protaetiae]